MPEDEARLTIGHARAMGYATAREWGDDLPARFSRHLHAETSRLEQSIEIYPRGYIEAVDVVAAITGKVNE